MHSPKKKRGRPRKPPPLTDMTAERFTGSNKRLRIMILEDTTTLASFLVNPPRTTKAGKSGWSFSQKLTVCVDGVDVACQCTGSVQGIRSDQWRGRHHQEEEEGSEAEGSAATTR